ncbi:MAG: hypothetical protein JNK82_06865 [Myxococcaceae bacterium]|nr:hypothetical protein [Myxococcaceae bacterium]
MSGATEGSGAASRVNDRVDKKWQEKGLESYSVAAILGTLQHYGVVLDEASFRELAKSKYPMMMAAEWAPKWKGTGQFAKFLPIAIGALWSKWLPAELTPEAVGVPLLGALRGLVEGDEGVTNKAFDLLDQELPRVPEGERRTVFLRELEPWLDASRISLEGLIDDLAQKGKVPQAQRLAGVSDRLFPDRKDVVKAVIDARTADKAAATATLTAIARDAGRPDMVRLAAIDALVPLDAVGDMFDVVAQIQEKAVKEGSTAVLYALHATTHLLGPHLKGPSLQAAQSLVHQQHAELERLTGRAAH